MPTYEYLCQTCSHRFEAWQKMIDEPLTVCPECGNHIRRVLYPAGIVFKGSGFYKTDHGNGAIPANNGKKGENGTNENGDTGESKSSESGASSGTETAKSASKSSESSASTAKGGTASSSTSTTSAASAATN